MELLQIRTKNDVNGNSRVLWVAIEGGAVVDGEGPHGYNRPERFRPMMDVVITVTPAEFKRWRYIVDAVVKESNKLPTKGSCSCRPGIERDNCPNCEGTGVAIDWQRYHASKRKPA
jgi:hypothetical protein